MLDSARRFPTIFAKMRTIDQKKDWVLSGPKQSLLKWDYKREVSVRICVDHINIRVWLNTMFMSVIDIQYVVIIED